MLRFRYVYSTILRLPGKDKLETERDVLGAYITFNNKADAQRALHAYRWPG